jgi:hypothetical protein
MAWVKIPAENHPLFRDALPKDTRISTLNMFGGVAAKVNGHMFAGLFGRSAIVKLSPQDQTRALSLDGAQMFDPMGNGRIMHDTVHLPDEVMDQSGQLRGWLSKAFEYASKLPPKAAKKKPAAKKKATATKKPAAKKPAAKKPAAKKK